jgi:hypothetical protein
MTLSLPSALAVTLRQRFALIGEALVRDITVWSWASADTDSPGWRPHSPDDVAVCR